MTKDNKFFTKIRAADDQPPIEAYAEEIPSNQYVVGNLNSQYKYTQTEDKDNGYGDTGTSETGELDKSASNKYLDKIASFKPIKDWTKRLVKNIKEAEPLTQVGLGAGTLMGVDKLKTRHRDIRTAKHHSKLEIDTLSTLQSIDGKLSKLNN